MCKLTMIASYVWVIATKLFRMENQPTFCKALNFVGSIYIDQNFDEMACALVINIIFIVIWKGCKWANKSHWRHLR